MLAGVLSFPDTSLCLPTFAGTCGGAGGEEGGMFSGSGPFPSLLALNHPSGCQCDTSAPEPLAAPGASLGCCSWGVKPSSSHGEEREAKRKWRLHLLLTKCCLITSTFCWLPLLVGPDGSVWLLKINHPPGRGAGERGEEVEMVEEEDSFAVPALQHHGDAGKGPLPQGGKGQLPAQHPCWTSSWLLLHLAGSKLAPSQ